MTSWAKDHLFDSIFLLTFITFLAIMDNILVQGKPPGPSRVFFRLWLKLPNECLRFLHRVIATSYGHHHRGSQSCLCLSKTPFFRKILKFCKINHRHYSYHRWLGSSTRDDTPMWAVFGERRFGERKVERKSK